jgi:hypothetical protein
VARSQAIDAAIGAAVVATYQHFEASGGRQHYRTAFLIKQDALPPRLRTAEDDNGKVKPYAVFSFELGSRSRPDSMEVATFDRLEPARHECIAWVGRPRESDSISATMWRGLRNGVLTRGVHLSFH